MSEPVLTGPGAGRTVSHNHRSTAELEYFLVARDESDSDLARFGLILHGPAMAA